MGVLETGIPDAKSAPLREFANPNAGQSRPPAAVPRGTGRSLFPKSADASLVDEMSSAPVLSRISFARFVQSELSE
jgi:hypothetical protein